MKIGLGAGLAVCLLLPVVLFLFGILGDAQAAAAVLLLGGLWTVLYGFAFARSRDRFYDVGFGIIVALLSTFDFLPLQYVFGLVLLSVIAIVVASAAMGRGKT
jgi:hypothetical protein